MKFKKGRKKLKEGDKAYYCQYAYMTANPTEFGVLCDVIHEGKKGFTIQLESGELYYQVDVCRLFKT